MTRHNVGSNTIISASTSISIVIGSLINPTISGATGILQYKTTDNNDISIDEGNFAGVTLNPNVLGQTKKQINHLSQKAGSTTSLTTTIRQFSNALISSDKIHISGFTSDYVFNDGGTTTCTVTSNSNQISSTTSTDTSGTNRILIVTLTGSITNGNVDTIITCNNIKIPTKVTSAINNILVKSTDSSDVIRDQDLSLIHI